jgi:hypothetical protein
MDRVSLDRRAGEFKSARRRPAGYGLATGIAGGRGHRFLGRGFRFRNVARAATMATTASNRPVKSLVRLMSTRRKFTGGGRHD